MAQADTLVALVKAASSGDQPSFRKSTEALIQEERGKGHRILADRLEKACERQSISRPYSSLLQQRHDQPKLGV